MPSNTDLRVRFRPVIRAHLRQQGDAQWSLLRRPHEVAYSTWRRWIREELAALKAEPITIEVDARAEPDPGDAAPRMVDVGNRLRRPEGQPIDVLAEVRRMLGLCDLLEKAALDAQGEGPGRAVVKDARALADAARTRAGVLRVAIEAHEKLAGLTRLQQAQMLLMRRIEQSAPEVARLVYEDLRAIDREFGITAGL